jgi:hypothetical protein
VTIFPTIPIRPTIDSRTPSTQKIISLLISSGTSQYDGIGKIDDPLPSCSNDLLIMPILIIVGLN